jgi:hypothetical protein
MKGSRLRLIQQVPIPHPAFWALTAVLLLAFGLRVYTLGDFNFNWDEGYSHWIVSLPYQDMIRTTAADVHPPLYYQLLRITQVIAGSGEFVNRYPSALLGLLSVALTFALGRTVAGWRVGLLAAVLIALSRATIDIAQLSRMHMLAAVFCTSGLWATILVWRRPGRLGPMLLYVISIAGALYSFYLAVMLPLATNLAFLIYWVRAGFPRRLLLVWIGLQIAAGLLFLPWAVYAVQLMHGWTAGDPLGFRAFLEFYAVTLTTGIPAFWQPYLSLIFGAIILIGIAVLILLARVWHSPWMTGKATLLLSSVMMPAIIVFLLTLPFHNLGRPLAGRYLPLMMAGFFVLVAWSIVVIARQQRVLAAVYGGFVIVVSLIGLSSTYQQRIIRDDFITVSEVLRAYRHSSDGLVLHNDRLWPHLNAEYDGAWLPVPYRQVVSSEYARLHLRDLWRSSDAVWLLQTHESIVNDPTGEIETWLQQRAAETAQWPFNNGLTLTLYARTAERAEDLLTPVPGYQSSAGMLQTSRGSVYLPLKRYPIGDSLTIPVFWSQPPDGPVTIELVGQEMHSYEFPAPGESPGGGSFQLLSVPLTADLLTGDYALYISASEHEPLGQITLVNYAPDASIQNAEIQHALNWRIGDSIALLGYDLASMDLRTGQGVAVNLYWRTDTPLTERYKVLVYVIGEFNPASGNPLWGEQDSEPLNWRLPTTQWPVNTVLMDPYRFTLYAGTPPGEYGLGVVVYELASGQRLQIYDAAGSPLGDTAIVTPITVSP